MDKKYILNDILVNELEVSLAFTLLLGNDTLYTEFLEVISKRDYSLSEISGISSSKMTKLLKLLLPNRPEGKSTKVDKYILSLRGLRECKDCSSIKPTNEFRRNSGRLDGLNSYCKVCQLSRTTKTQPKRQAQYKASKLQRIVPWTDLVEISKFYSKCPEGHHVDHVIPLQGELVSGLHVINNLQYLTIADNLSKNNKFNVM